MHRMMCVISGKMCFPSVAASIENSIDDEEFVAGIHGLQDLILTAAKGPIEKLSLQDASTENSFDDAEFVAGIQGLQDLILIAANGPSEGLSQDAHHFMKASRKVLAKAFKLFMCAEI